MGSEAKTEGVGIFVAEKWVDSVVSVERHTHTHTHPFNGLFSGNTQVSRYQKKHCGSYRGIKLLEHAMKVVERIFEHRIRQQIIHER